MQESLIFVKLIDSAEAFLKSAHLLDNQTPHQNI